MSGNHVHPHRHLHDEDHHHPHTPGLLGRRAALRGGAVGLGAILLAACSSAGNTDTASSGGKSETTLTDATDVDTTAPAVTEGLAGFEAFCRHRLHLHQRRRVDGRM